MRRRFIFDMSKNKNNNNIIKYTTTDGNILIPYVIDFGVVLLSNTYIGAGTILFKDEIKYIGDDVFNACTRLTSIEIPNSVRSIGYDAFRYCTNLTSIEIPNSVRSIGDRAFDGCSSLASVIIGNSVSSIGRSAFYLCGSLTSIEIPNSVTSIGDDAFFNCKSLTSVEIGNNIENIGNDAFYKCENLTSIEIPNSVKSIGDDAFEGCSSLTSVIWNSIRCSDFYNYSRAPFYGCTNITSFTFGENIEHVPAFLCYNLKNLTSIEIPNSVTSIGDDAFRHCTSVTSVYIKATTPPILLGDIVFNNNASNRKIYVPRASLNAYKTASGWSEYADAIEPYDY